MNYAVLLLLLLFSVTFGFSAWEKITDWKGNEMFLKSYFKETWVPPFVSMIMGVLLVVELLATVIGVLAMFQVIQDKNYNNLSLYAGLLYCLALLILLIGQRIAKDYDGARNIVIYFLPAVFLVFLVQ
ncbi:MAG TPA: hypothetical protein VK050_08440 [Flavobacteriaceae bacterium]|nr:hypothetical protein [Flavobacteriaceae bacterium]